MARLPRLAIGGRTHYLIQRAHGERALFADDADRQHFLAALRSAAQGQRVAVHAYALGDAEVQLLATPPEASALSAMMQALGRSYVSAYNRRHGRSGTLWNGRFRAAVVEPGAWTLAALTLIDGAAAAQTSASHHDGSAHEAWLVDPPEVWQLGNTPFDREAACRRLLTLGVAADQALQLREAALGGWAIGSRAFLAEAARNSARAVRPRTRGRPRRAVAGATAPR